MVRISNAIITVLNILTLIISLAGIVFSLMFHKEFNSPSQKVLNMTLLVVGGSLLVVSLLGLIGSCCRLSFFMWIYLFVLFMSVLGLIGFTVLAIVVTNKGIGKAVSSRGFGEHRLGDNSKWLQKYVVNAENWEEICIANVCHHVEDNKGEDFYKHKISPIQSGCCKPPNYCGFEFQNATYWIMPRTGPQMPDPDCKTWSNVQKQLCFDCESSKTAILDNIKKEWRLLAFIIICILVLVIIIYSLSCCALRNNLSRDYKYSRYP